MKSLFLLVLVTFSSSVYANTQFKCVVEKSNGDKIEKSVGRNEWGSFRIEFTAEEAGFDVVFHSDVTGKSKVTVKSVTVSSQDMKAGDYIGLRYGLEWGNVEYKGVSCSPMGGSDLPVRAIATSVACSGHVLVQNDTVGEAPLMNRELPSQRMVIDEGVRYSSIDWFENGEVPEMDFTPGLSYSEDDANGPMTYLESAAYFDKHESLDIVVGNKVGQKFNFRRKTDNYTVDYVCGLD